MSNPIIVHNINGMRDIVRDWQKSGLKVGLVPTMGALHDGHLSLVEALSHKADRIIVSIFVNPTQFSAHEDLDKYPRTIESDIEKLATTKADLAFIPSVAEMYGKDFNSSIHVEGPSSGLETDERPHFFKGVSLVVLKLFMQSLANVAIFGEKDYQQLLVIRKMVRDLDLPIEIMSGPIMREADGLAMSSRNFYLSPEQRAIAAKLNIILQALANSTAAHQVAEEDAKRALLEAGFSAVDYACIRDADSLAEPNATTTKRRALIVARLGEVRLLDNMEAI
jgi:pantoate--beta-alanine ligase